MANEKTLIRFRCYRCSKLLGTTTARAGKTTTCPNCKADLIVPEPDDSEKAALAEATRALIPDLDAAPSRPDGGPEPASRHDPTFSWEELDTAIFQAPGGPSPIDLPISFAPPEPSPASEPSSTPPVEPSPTPEPTAPPVEPAIPKVSTAPEHIPEIAVTPDLVRTDRASRRRPNEVILTQSVITSWAVFMLMALGISFVAGLFVGHFVWKG